MCHLRLLLVDIYLLPAGTRRRIGKHLRMTASIESDEQESSFIDRLSTGNHAVVLQNHTATCWTKRLCDPSTFLGREYCTAVSRIDGEVIVEAESVLVKHLDWATEAREGFAVYRVRVARSIEIWSGLMNFGVNSECWSIDGCLVPPWQDLAFLIHEYEVGDFDLREVRA